jgi:predicted molibdopterin-dependent oxidoreductase YjgC
MLGIATARFASRAPPAPDFSHPGIEVRLDACIQCTRCVRACREVQVNDVIGYAWRGQHSKIVFDLDDAMGDSTCVGCMVDRTTARSSPVSELRSTSSLSLALNASRVRVASYFPR